MIGFFIALILLSSFVVGIIFLISLLKKSSHYKWLLKELELWKDKEIINTESLDKIKKLYTPKHKEAIPPVKIMISIGSLLLGIGLILFIASNWQNINGQIKLLATFTLSLITLFIGYSIKFSKSKPFPLLGDGLLFVSTLIWGATIIFLFQNYQVSASNNYILVFLWGATIFPVAIWFHAEPIYYLSFFLLFLAGIFRGNFTETPNYMYLLLGFIPFLLTAKDKKHRLIPISILVILMPIFTRFEVFDLYYLLLLSLFLLWYFWKKEEMYIIFSCSSLFFYLLTSIDKSILSQYVGYWFFLLPFAVLLYVVFWKKSTASLFILLFNFVIGILIQFVNNSDVGENLISATKIILLVGLFYLLIERVIKDKLLKLPFLFIGYISFLIPAFVLSFYEIIQKSLDPKILKGFLFYGRFESYRLLSIIVLVIVFGTFIYRMLVKMVKESGDALIFTISGLSFLSILFLEILPLFKTGNNFTLWFLTFYQNAFLLCIILFTIFWAYKKSMNWLINIGLVFFLIFLIMRYFDAVWKLLDRSLFFIIGGIVLLAIGFFMEKLRRKLMGDEIHE